MAITSPISSTLVIGVTDAATDKSGSSSFSSLLKSIRPSWYVICVFLYEGLFSFADDIILSRLSEYKESDAAKRKQNTKSFFLAIRVLLYLEKCLSQLTINN